MRGAGRRAAAAVLAATLLLAGVAEAGDAAARAAAQASFERAEAAARARRFAEAVAAYRAAIAADPSAPVAAPARARIEDLEAHGEGGFAPLARLDEIRKDPQKAGDRAAVEALARDAEVFPPGRVRAEARVFVAEAWWHKLGEPARAAAVLEEAVSDPSGDRLTRSLALAELVALRRERGEIGAALRVAERDPTLSPAILAQLRRLVRRERLRVAAEVLLAALGLAGAAAIARLAAKARDVRDLPSRLVRPIGVAFALYLGGAGALLVHVHGDADARPFVWLGLGVLALDVIARALRLAAGRRLAARAAMAAACVAGVVAAAFLAVLWTSVDYLDGIGL